jgi:ArsR family transcriptional regulator
VAVQLDKNVYRLQAQIAKALAHPLRLEILHCLGDSELAFGRLQHQVKVSKSNLSQHLAIMRGAGIVIDRREGNVTFYRLVDHEILQACRCLAGVLRRHLSRGARLAAVATPRGRR